MAFVNDEVFNQGLAYLITNGTTVHICSSEPVTFAGVATVTLGNAPVVIPAAQDGATDGRRVVVPSVTSGSVTGTGTATHWAITDGTGILVATGDLSASQAVTSGNLFTLAAFSITIRDAVNEA